MKKKVIIISILIILLVIIGVTSYCVSKNKISNIQVNEDPILANDLSSVETDNDENAENLIVEEEQKLDENNIETEEQETETSIQIQTTQPIKSSSKATSKVETQKAETKSEVVKETSTTKEETPTKVDIPSTTTAVEPKQETKVEEKPTRCTNNSNHSMEVGNSGKWFSSKSEAIAYYNSQVSYYSNLWETEQIDDATYYSRCPSGYEVWDCIYCSKWTINFYYR